MNNAQRRRQHEEDELTLVVWYQNQPGMRTTKTDQTIGEECNWFIPRRRRQELNAQGIRVTSRTGDADRVQRTRRRIDRNTEQWADYSFGTRGGLGRFTSSLSCNDIIDDDAAVPHSVDHAKGQVFREFQRVRHQTAELERETGKFLRLEIIFHELGDHERATTCAMVAADIASRSQNLISPTALRRLIEQGMA